MSDDERGRVTIIGRVLYSGLRSAALFQRRDRSVGYNIIESHDFGMYVYFRTPS
jgi:hypothetical protein